FSATTEGGHEAAELGKGAGDESGAGGGAEARTINGAGAEGIDILEGAREFHSDPIAGGVRTEGRAGEGGSDRFGRRVIVAGEGHCGGTACRDIGGKARAREHIRDRAGGGFGEHLALPLQGALFEALGG